MAEGGQSLDLITPERLQQLITRIDALELESKDAWNTDGVHLLDMQLIVTDIIGEQAELVTPKFSEFHYLWLERGASDEVSTFYSLNEINETVTTLENALGTFETKAHTAIQLIKEAIVSFQEKFAKMQAIREKLENPSDLSLEDMVEFETYLNADFTWINTTEIPDIAELKEEWDAANMYNVICGCVDQMRSINPPQEPVDPATGTAGNPEEISESSSSPDTPELQT